MLVPTSYRSLSTSNRKAERECKGMDITQRTN